MMKGSSEKPWESKLLQNSSEYLRKRSGEFSKDLERLREPVPPEILEILRPENLFWLNLYRLNREPKDVDIFRNVLSSGMKAVLEGRRPLEFKEKLYVGYVWILKYEQLFILNNLLHPIILLEKIKKGDEKAFLDFVKVDKSILATDFARPFISRAQLEADKKFFKKLSKALLFDPRKLSSPTLKLFHFLMVISGLAVEKLTIPEICDILHDCCGIWVDDAETVRKFWNRHNLHRSPFQTFQSET